LSGTYRWLYLAYCTVLIGLLLAAGELIARSKGIRPWRVEKIGIVVEPGGKFFTAHPTLGYTHLSGEFDVTLPTGHRFHTTNLATSLRATRAPHNHEEHPKGEIWIFGCSITYGWSLEDEETYAWLLQQRFPKYDIVNFGVNGYGTLHSLIQFREALEQGRSPRLAIIAYSSFHDERNTFLRIRRKTLAPWNQLGPLEQPYARIGRNGELKIRMADVTYREFPLMRVSALAHLVEETYNLMEDRFCHSRSVTKAIVEEFARLAREPDVELLVAGLDMDPASRSFIGFCRTINVNALDLLVSLAVEENRNWPRDGHPSAIAHARYAQNLEVPMRRLLREQRMRGS
jgi:hypothetical protein